MPYALSQDLIDRYSAGELAQLSDHSEGHLVDGTLLQITIDGGDRSAYTQAERDAADAALARIDQALTDAGAEIDGYLNGRYTLPLVTVPAVLLRTACKIARYYLYDDRATEQVEARYKDAVKYLTGVAKGEISLGLSDQGEAPAQADGAQMQSGGRVFDRGESGGFI